LRERDYFNEPFTAEELHQLLGDRLPSSVFSWRSPTARKLGLSSQQGEIGEDELLSLMVEEPNLIRRPLMRVNGEIVAGFDKPAKARLGELLGKSF
jgi:arsenate reductase-like glutaredoxin family protein